MGRSLTRVGRALTRRDSLVTTRGGLGRRHSGVRRRGGLCGKVFTIFHPRLGGVGGYFTGTVDRRRGRRTLHLTIICNICLGQHDGFTVLTGGKRIRLSRLLCTVHRSASTLSFCNTTTLIVFRNSNATLVKRIAFLCRFFRSYVRDTLPSLSTYLMQLSIGGKLLRYHVTLSGTERDVPRG